MPTDTIAAEPDLELGPPSLDPSRLLDHPDGLAALAALVARLRAVRFDGGRLAGEADDPAARTCVALARGEVVDVAAARDALGDDLDVLLDAGVAAGIDDEAFLTAQLFPMRSIYSVLPRHRVDQDIVYLGPDSVCLLDVVWSARGFGDRAVDLATGNGFIGAALATRYDHVVATDLSHRCVATAALIPHLNPQLRGRFAAVRSDVTAGLTPGSFDLVTANAPWVPEAIPVEEPSTDDSLPRLFAAGGPTGFELPRRFIDEAIELLAPGGRACIACSDLAFEDGARPLLDHLEVVRARGVEVDVVETAINARHDFAEWAARRAPGSVGARHVVVELRRAS